MKKFTDEEIEAFRKYELVRQSGAYNMFDPRARAMAGLSSSEFTFVMENFPSLITAAKAQSK